MFLICSVRARAFLTIAAHPVSPAGMEFIPGIALARRWFHEAVEPAVAAALPRLRYGAALVGAGSEVQGFDTPMSTDHDWGARVLLFLAADDLATQGAALRAALAGELPGVFLGWPARADAHAL